MTNRGGCWRRPGSCQTQVCCSVILWADGSTEGLNLSGDARSNLVLGQSAGLGTDGARLGDPAELPADAGVLIGNSAFIGRHGPGYANHERSGNGKARKHLFHGVSFGGMQATPLVKKCLPTDQCVFHGAPA